MTAGTQTAAAGRDGGWATSPTACCTPAPRRCCWPTSPPATSTPPPGPRSWKGIAQDAYLNAATAREPVAVLGAAAAQRLGFDRIWPGTRIWVGGQWFYVTGILSPAALAPEIDSSILIGFPAAEKYLHFDGHPAQIYIRTTKNDQAVTTAVDTCSAPRPTRKTQAR